MANKKKRPSKAPTLAVPKSVQERQLRVLRQVQLSTRITSGPIPDPEEMMRYQQVQSDLPERIMRQYEKRTDMAERQSEHRMAMETKVVSNNVLMERLGLASAFTIGAIVLVGSMLLIDRGKPLVGFSGVILSLGTLLGLYVFSRKDQIQEITKKRAADLLKKGATLDELEVSPGSPAAAGQQKALPDTSA